MSADTSPERLKPASSDRVSRGWLLTAGVTTLIASLSNRELKPREIPAISPSQRPLVELVNIGAAILAIVAFYKTGQNYQNLSKK